MIQPQPNPADPQRPRNMAEAMAAAPAWPNLTRTQEGLLKAIWARQQLTGWCFTSEVELGKLVGVTDRQVRRLIRQLCPRCIQRRHAHGEVLLLRAKPPDGSPQLYGSRKPRTSMSTAPRTSASAHPGHGCPPNNTKFKSNELGGHAAKPEATLFNPIKCDLKGEQFRLGMTTLCDTVVALFNAGRITRCKTPVRRFPRLLAMAELGRIGNAQTVRLVFPGTGGAAYTVDFTEDLILKLEFYP